MWLTEDVRGFDGAVKYKKGEWIRELRHCIVRTSELPTTDVLRNIVSESIVLSDLPNTRSKGCDFRDCIFMGRLLDGGPHTFRNCNFSFLGLLPSPGEMLRTYHWGRLSPTSQALAIRLDMASHERPWLFLEWAKGGKCPYKGSAFPPQVNFIPNAENFRESFLFSPPPRPIEVLKVILHEECPLWDKNPLEWIDHHIQSATIRNAFRKALIEDRGYGVYEALDEDGYVKGRYFANGLVDALDFHAKKIGYFNHSHLLEVEGVGGANATLHWQRLNGYPPPEIMETE